MDDYSRISLKNDDTEGESCGKLLAQMTLLILRKRTQ